MKTIASTEAEMPKFWILCYDPKGNQYLRIGEYAATRWQALAQAMAENWRPEDMARLHNIEICNE